MRIEFSELGVVAPEEVARRTEAAPPRPAPPLSFDMPGRVLMSVVLLAVGYVGVMALAFAGGPQDIGLVFMVFGIVLAGFYGLPYVMARASGGLQPGSFERRGAWGIDTASGYLSSHAALAQILTVPVLMLGWALFVYAII
ncbi:hypothetical protein [Polymorphobacter sp.]|uniref:hypothetical protein n=1 Tax=Polymorphobacter sp. TaxID=1909290 RepID=UPI003F7112F9